MKKKTRIFGAMLAVLLTFGFLVSCGDSGGGGGGEPVSVNKSLPSVQSLDNFSGNFVASDADAGEMIGDVLYALEYFDFDDVMYSISPAVNLNSRFSSPAMNARTASRSAARASDSYSDYVTFKNEKIANGVYATGYMQWSFKYSVKNATKYDNPEAIWEIIETNPSIGDYFQDSEKIKFALTFDKANQGGVIFTDGKYVLDADYFYKEQAVSINPLRANLTGRASVSNGYAFSVSKSGKGMKFVMKLEGKATLSAKNVLYSEIDDAYDSTEVDFLLTIDVYDNTNEKKYSKSFTDPDEAYNYLGFDLFGFFDYS